MTSTLAASDAVSHPTAKSTRDAASASEAPIAIPWQQRLAPFKRPVVRKALIQLVNTALPFALGWYLMLRSLEVSYWITLALAVPMAGLYIRLFIFQHDCGHGSFLPWRRWNDAIGYVIGILTLTPYGYWKRTHAIHHATHGNLDRREFGDIETLTVREYLARPWWGRLAYRIYRHPATLLLVAPTYQFALKQRLPFDTPLSWRREWRSVMLNNLGIAAVLVLAWQTIGLHRLLLVQGPIFLIGGALGIWLFFIQHQFEDTYWDRGEEWDYDQAGLAGSSFFDLHPVLHWLTGNIGYHHIHHLSSRIPNYRLAETLRAIPELHDVTKITVWQSLKCARLKLWDEKSRRLVGFDHLRGLGAGA
ncbi:MAG: fatty acid desaturase [Holophagales bacterium]|nr:fatty acid desaturase [Holophagales bacterium]